jgi:hypothetical protein
MEKAIGTLSGLRSHKKPVEPPPRPIYSPPLSKTAHSSRGLGHSPLKAGTRVRIPYALLDLIRFCGRLSGLHDGCMRLLASALLSRNQMQLKTRRVAAGA